MLSLVLHANVAVLTAVLVAATLAASPIRPVIGAALPNLAVDDDLESANGYVQALRNTAVVAGPVVAGLGVAVIGAQGIFFVAALSLLLAAIVLSFVRGPFHAPEASGEDSGSFLEGFAVLRRDSVLLTLTAAGVVALLVAACALVADLPFAIEDLGIGETGYGVLVAMWGIGMTGGSLFAPAIVRRFGAPAVIGTGLVIEGAGILAAAATTVPRSPSPRSWWAASAGAGARSRTRSSCRSASRTACAAAHAPRSIPSARRPTRSRWASAASWWPCWARAARTPSQPWAASWRAPPRPCSCASAWPPSAATSASSRPR